MKKVSIVVPVYNVEKYISKCLDSCLAQDYESFDVLVIHDGSPDNSQRIIDCYASKDQRIKPTIKENGGYGSVLELAFKLSDADFILVCDPDDYLDPRAISTLVKIQNESGADLVVGAKNLVFSDNDEIKYDKSYNNDFGSPETGKVYKRGEQGSDTFYFLEPSPHSTLYPLNIIKSIQFPSKVSYTDNLLYFYTLSHIDSIVYSDEALSYYLINREGNTRTDIKPTIIDAWVTVFKEICRQCPEKSEIFVYRLFEAFYSIYYKIDNISGGKDVKESKYELLYEYLKELIPYREAIIKTSERYQDDNPVIKRQKAGLLDPNNSYRNYKKLYRKRLYGSFKQSVKNYIVESPVLSKLYEKYHFHAKYIKTRNDPKIILSEGVHAEPVLKEGTTFFGYYDKPCFAYGKSLMHRINSTSLDLNQTADILVNGEKVSETNCWNWQQGSMATWLSENEILHNFFDGKHYRSKKINLITKQETVYELPVYTVSPKGFALTLNFSRLAKLRPDYGYFNLPYQQLKEDSEDGIYYLDMQNNKGSLFVSLDKIKSVKPSKKMDSAIHKVNHLDLSPNSKNVIFLHRYFNDGVKTTRLMLLNIRSKEMKVLADNGMVSHMAWVNDELLFGYLRRKDGTDGYAYIDLDGNETPHNHELLVDDGHPTVYNERYIVTDSYPDYTCNSKLILIDRQKNDVRLLGRFYSGKPYQGTKRCDLHPRFDKEGKALTIDTVCEGVRKVYHINLDAIIE